PKAEATGSNPVGCATLVRGSQVAAGAERRHRSGVPAPSIATRAERLIYRVQGLPVALSALSKAKVADPLKSAFAWRYWHPDGLGEWLELIGGLLTWPIALVLGSLWFTARNGAAIRRRYGRGVAAQFGDQLRLYFSAGVLA